MKHFCTNLSGAKCRLDIYRWGAGLAVTGPIRDIGQNVLLSAFETGSSSSSYCHSLLLIAFLEGALIRNVIYILCINGNNAVINNNLRKAPRPSFALQNSQGHLKEFLRNLQAIWARAIKKYRQPCYRVKFYLTTRRMCA